jgi:hypothetical protein
LICISDKSDKSDKSAATDTIAPITPMAPIAPIARSMAQADTRSVGVSCKYSGCGDKVPRSNLTEHSR